MGFVKKMVRAMWPEATPINPVVTLTEVQSASPASADVVEVVVGAKTVFDVVVEVGATSDVAVVVTFAF